MTEADLSSFPEQTIHPDRILYRVHQEINDPLYFSTTGEGRFDLAKETGAGTCYLGLSPIGAFLETLGRFRTLTQQMIDERALSSLSVTHPLRLADLTDRTIIGRFGITGDLATSDNYQPSQEWASRFYDAGLDGIFYAARHDPSFTERSVALFGNEEGSAKLFEIVTEPIPPKLVDEACQEFSFEIWPPAPLF